MQSRTKVIDFGDPSITDLARSYASILPAKVKTLREELRIGNLKGASAITHRLRGSAWMYGFTSLADAVGLLDQAVRHDHRGAAVQELLVQLQGLVDNIARETNLMTQVSPVVAPADDQPLAAAATVRRTPFYFNSQGARLFAWHHQSEQGLPKRRGVIICPPLGYEQVCTHRALRHLADALAVAGFPVMRFDYHGTGDSAGFDDDPERHATWLANIRSAIGVMRYDLGCSSINLVGLRLGAALAVQSAAVEPVADLVLWAPVIKGRAYIRELKALSKTAASPAQPSKDIEAAGFVIAEQTLQDLDGLNLLHAHPACQRALIVARDDLTPGDDARLADRLQGLGLEAQLSTEPGFAGMMAESHLTTVPRQAIAKIVAWMRAGTDKEDRSFVSLSPRPLATPLDSSERAVRICRDPDLFGILSVPAMAAASAGDLPAVILVNTGADYRIGPNRLNVLLARRLAAQGFRCLRMDLCGLGDSVTADPSQEAETYPATALRDINLAMQYLQSGFGVRRVVLMGLCSGAYAAFQAAVQCPGPVLTHAVLINPLTFYWQPGMTLQTAQSVKFKAYQDSMASARRPEKWLRFLTGRSKIGMAGAIRLLVERWQLRRQLGRQQPISDDALAAAPGPSHPTRNNLPGDLLRIANQDRRLTLFFARSDPGYDILTFHAKRQVENMCRTGQMFIHFIEDADHTFSRRGPREALLHAVTAELCGRYHLSQLAPVG